MSDSRPFDLVVQQLQDGKISSAAVPPLPHRPQDGHKGTFGRVLVFGGCPGMSGAPALSGQAALRAGAGLVTVAVPQSVQSVVAAAWPSYTTWGLPTRPDGKLAGEAVGQVRWPLSEFSAVAAGPGWGMSLGASRILRTLLAETSGPTLVLDADALNLIARYRLISLCGNQQRPSILTPHPGEFRRLAGVGSSDCELNSMEQAVGYAAEHRIVLVLKGHRTIVTDGKDIYQNSTGNSGMATGGSGDVLTGIIAGLAAQGMDPFAAAVLGVFLHGLAGDVAAGLHDSTLSAADSAQPSLTDFSRNPRAITAVDLLDNLAAAFALYKRPSEQQTTGSIPAPPGTV